MHLPLSFCTSILIPFTATLLQSIHIFCFFVAKKPQTNIVKPSRNKILVFAAHGKLFEKYNGLTGDIDAVSEYGTPEMLGWTAGVYMNLLCE